MNLTKALKEKKKLIKKIDENFNRFKEYNSVEEDIKPIYDATESYNNFTSLTNQLVDLKTRIQKANQPIYSKIFEIAELKNQIQKLRSVDTTNGIVKSRYDTSVVTYKAVFGKLEMDIMISNLEEKIESLQSEIETFNAITII